MHRPQLVHWWDEAHKEGVWWAAWGKAVEGVTAEEAAWKPESARGAASHCIWQIVEHMIHWREYFIHRNRGGEPMAEDELERRNWREITDRSEAAWRATCERFSASHATVRVLLADPAAPPPPKPQLDPRYLLFHDSHHVGQIMYIRALLGKEPLES